MKDSDRNAELWHALRVAEDQFFKARHAFVAGAPANERTLEEALSRVSDRGTALRLLAILPEQNRRAVFARLVDLASVGHSDIALVRSVILNMERPWVVSNIEPLVDVILEQGDEEEYRRFAELFAELDEGLLRRHVERCLRSPSSDVREVGDDFRANT